MSDGYRSAPDESHLSLLCVVAIRLRLAGSTLVAFTPDLQHPERSGLCSLGQHPAIINILFQTDVLGRASEVLMSPTGGW